MEGDQEGDFHGGGGGGSSSGSSGVHSQPESSGSVDMNYLLSKFGILKVLEIVSNDHKQPVDKPKGWYHAF